MRLNVRFDCSFLLLFIFMVGSLVPISVLQSCGKTKGGNPDTQRESLRQVLYVQSLYNNHHGEEIEPQIRNVIDSMRNEGRNPYYFAAVNVLIDWLFSNGRFAEADSMAVSMAEEALKDRDSVSMAMARRVRAQMFYKLSQTSRALQELEPTTSYISNPYSSPYEFGTATNIREWLWIISRELGDTLRMNKAGMSYARMVEENEKVNHWTDSTGHYPVTALSFRAEEAFTGGNLQRALILLDSASSKVSPSLPARAYEHLYAVRCRVRAAQADWAGAIEDVETLLRTHKDFPSFYLKDLLLQAEILAQAGKDKESARAYSEYVAFHDSLSNMITAKRLNDLSVLYRTEIDREHKRTERFQLFALGAVILALIVFLIFLLINNAKEKKRHRLLVEHLNEMDRATETAYHSEQEDQEKELSPIERLDRYIYKERPYTNPALSRKELAEFSGLSQDALGQLIMQEKGISVRTYINSFRLDEARRILGSDSTEGIAEMAVRLGFGTVRTLQRSFKERYDMSPTQYRDAWREKR